MQHLRKPEAEFADKAQQRLLRWEPRLLR